MMAFLSKSAMSAVREVSALLGSSWQTHLEGGDLLVVEPASICRRRDRLVAPQ
jgi:hypothetical protein